MEIKLIKTTRVGSTLSASLVYSALTPATIFSDSSLLMGSGALKSI